MVLRIGVHPNNLHLQLAQHWRGAFADLAFEFVPYTEGRDTGQLLVAGRFDVGGTGSTPPIIAQVEGADVRYLAASAPRPANGAILVTAASRIRTVADLAGKRIALLNGSFHTYLLARVLEDAGRALRDVSRIELAPAASRAALADGKVDAWIAMAPHLDQALAAGTVRVLVPCGATIPNRSVFWTVEQRGLSAAQIDGFTAALVRLGGDIGRDPDRAARILSDLKIGGADLAGWRNALGTRDWTIVRADAAVLAEQKAEADTLFRHGEIARTIQPLAAADLTTARPEAAAEAVR